MADEYEKRFMGGDGALFVERIRNRMALRALMGGAIGALISGIALAAQTGSIGPALASLGFAVLYVGGLSLFFLFIRTSVTREQVHVQLGLFGPKIPVAAITEVVRGKPFQLGVRSYAFGGRESVNVTWMDGGKARTVQVGTNDAAGLMAAIERARGAPATPVRIAEGVGEDRADLERAMTEAESTAEAVSERSTKAGR